MRAFLRDENRGRHMTMHHMESRDSFAEGKADHSFPSSTEVKDDGTITSLPLTDVVYS
jgi:hypothetical protein